MTLQLRSEKPLPVIIFLFGGGYERGDPTKALHGPDYFMMKDAVFVTIGYRLGPFGKIKLIVSYPDISRPFVCVFP